MKVLIVDDDDSIRNLLTIALSLEAGFGEIRSARDGVEAVQECRRFAPDVIVLDYWMPEMAGDVAAEAIRKLHPQARIIVFSGVVESKPEWADAYVIKGHAPGIKSVIDLALDMPA
jgi:chemotaxis response regulator CheB